MKVFHCLLLTIGMLATANTVIGQSSSIFVPGENMPVSPNATSFSRYGGFSSDLYTGNIPISIPICTLQDGDVSLPVSLNTRTGSIKVSEIPGWVGNGWNLSTGGVITRSIKHLPDDLFGGEGNNYAGYFYNLQTNILIDNLISTGQPLGTDLDSQIEMGILDMTPDIFYYNLPGYSGSFSYALDEIVMMPEQNVKIERIDNSQEHFVEGWIMTTPEGMVYTFAAKAIMEKEFYFGLLPWDCKVVTAWYLVNITSSKPGGGAINIFYKPINGERVVINYSDVYDFWGCGDNILVNLSQESVNFLPIEYVDSIKTSNSCLEFKTSPVTRFQNSQQYQYQRDWKLDTIKLYNNENILIKKWGLDYGESLQYDRFQLMQLTELSPENEIGETHKFDYYGSLENSHFRLEV